MACPEPGCSERPGSLRQWAGEMGDAASDAPAPVSRSPRAPEIRGRSASRQDASPEAAQKVQSGQFEEAVPDCDAHGPDAENALGHSDAYPDRAA